MSESNYKNKANYKNNKHTHSHHSGYHYSNHHDSSSEMERRSDTIIYKNFKKQKMLETAKRLLFCLVVFILVIFIISSIFSSDASNGSSLFRSNRVKTEELNELKIKIIQYEERIKELEEIIFQYESGELPSDNSEDE